MLISLDYKFIFIANLKNASTAIEAALRPFADIALVESRFDKHLPFADIESRFRWVFDRASREEYLIFGVMRDPVDWVISLYNSHGEQRFHDAQNMYTGNMTFSQFLEEWFEHNPDQIVPQYTRFLGADGNIGANYLISYSKLEEGMHFVGDRLGIPVAKLSPLDRLNVSEPRLCRDDLSAEEHHWISRHFEDDRRFMTRFCDRPLGEAERDWKRASNTDVDLVHAIYRVFLLREPDPEGMVHSLQLLRNGGSAEDLMRWCLRSQEFYQKHQDFIGAHLNPPPVVTQETSE